MSIQRQFPFLLELLQWKESRNFSESLKTATEHHFCGLDLASDDAPGANGTDFLLWPNGTNRRGWLLLGDLTERLKLP